MQVPAVETSGLETYRKPEKSKVQGQAGKEILTSEFFNIGKH